jgi:hypothetical protein
MLELFKIFQFDKVVFVSDDLRYRVGQRYSPIELNRVTIPILVHRRTGCLTRHASVRVVLSH